MSGNPAFFEFFRLGLLERLRANAQATRQRADKAAIFSFATKLVAEATRAGLCDDITDADRDDVVARVCARAASWQPSLRQSAPTPANSALWTYACPRSRIIALASARRHGGVPNRQELEIEIRALVATYRAGPGCDAPDDDAEGVIARLVEFRSNWRPRRATLASDNIRRPGATALARRALSDAVRNLVTDTAGPEPRLYKGLHRDRPSGTLGTGKKGRLTPRRPSSLRASTSAIHAVLADRAESQKRRPPSRSAVARAVRNAVGAPDREARLAALPGPARRVYKILTSVLPGNRLSAVRLADLAERVWGPAGNASTGRGHRKRCIQALAALTAARIDINAVAIGDRVLVGRGRKVPTDAEAALRTLKTRDLPAAKVALDSGIWATPEGRVAKAYLCVMAREATADDYDELSIFLGNPRLLFVRRILRSEPSWAEAPYDLLEEARRNARHVLINPTVAECDRGHARLVGAPEQVTAADELLVVLDAACGSYVDGWEALASDGSADASRVAELRGAIAQVRDATEWRSAVAGPRADVDREVRRAGSGGRRMTQPPARSLSRPNAS